MAEQQLPTCDLRPIKRVITDHNAEGLAVFNKDVSETIPTKILPIGDVFHLGYATNQQPVDFSQDVPTYQGYLAKNPGITVPGGSVLRVVDIVPGGISPMHRTVSLDYGVVVEGTIELVLDSGEVKTLQRGDIAVQRGTMHQWRNASKTEWGRMLFVLQESKPIEVDGKALGEDYGVGMGDVPSSSS
ncbi:hypothetical protein GQ53DRAFT_748262 [Thozetella sp. PMI_491]|nr:hypothetical protein GQ53DRAFT_748262 [Thozetella sp. PMI_491]